MPVPKDLCQKVSEQDQAPVRLAACAASIPQLPTAQGDCYDRGIAGLGPKIIKYIKIFVLSTTEAQFLKMNGQKTFVFVK